MPSRVSGRFRSIGRHACKRPTRAARADGAAGASAASACGGSRRGRFVGGPGPQVGAVWGTRPDAAPDAFVAMKDLIAGTVETVEVVLVRDLWGPTRRFANGRRASHDAPVEACRWSTDLRCSSPTRRSGKHFEPVIHLVAGWHQMNRAPARPGHRVQVREGVWDVEHLLERAKIGITSNGPRNSGGGSGSLRSKRTSTSQ
jgi:hypothetical protein